MEKPDAGPDLEALATRARGGDRDALERVMAAVQDKIYGLAVRMLWHPQDAEDATQEILIRIITHIGTFRGDSGFLTWCYRIASNHLVDVRRGRMEGPLTFAEFGADLDQGVPDGNDAFDSPVERALLLEEVKIGCTLGMLLCLDRGHRLAYILGEILELDHSAAADALGIAPDAYRKRLSRARNEIVSFTREKCGLVGPENPCRCGRRIEPAVKKGRVDPARLLHATIPEAARRFPQVLSEIRRLDELQRAAALYRSHPEPRVSAKFAHRLRDLLDSPAGEL